MMRQGYRANAALLACACGLLLVLPFVTTFNDFLTVGATRLGLVGPIQAVAPLEARMVVALLGLVGAHAGVDGSQLMVQAAAGQWQSLLISWNCVGWQSLVLLGLSLVAGLRDGYPLATRLQVVFVGVLGTLWVNLVRIGAVVLLASSYGYTAAVLFHDYGGTAMTVAWLFAFWALAYRWILPEPVEENAP